MTIMSIEGLDADDLMKEDEYSGMNRDETLEKEYARMIDYYDTKYQESHLTNDCNAISPHVQ